MQQSVLKVQEPGAPPEGYEGGKHFDKKVFRIWDGWIEAVASIQKPVTWEEAEILIKCCPTNHMAGIDEEVLPMFDEVSKWLDQVLEDALETGIPKEVTAFGFNLYEDGDYDWSMELVGTSEFDMDNEDWLCNEVTDFDTRDDPFQWNQKAEWEEILKDITCLLKKYLNSGKYANVLKEKSGIGVGFVDGNIEILYANIAEK